MRSLSPGRIWTVARATFWFIPTVCVLAAIVLANGLPIIDRLVGDQVTDYLFPGPPEGARSFLGAIISAMISFTGLVFSITVVVLVLTSGQFSPRVLRRFLRDGTIQWALGVFVATFVYAMIVIRSVLGTNGNDAFVPRIAVTTAFVLVLLSVGLFIHYINHIAHVIRVSSIVTGIGGEARELLERRWPDRDETPPELPTVPADAVVPAPRSGIVVTMREATIVSRAQQEGRVVAMVPRFGDYVPEGAPLFRVHGGTGDPDWLASYVTLSDERTMERDLAFGFRQLVDIGERALSPGINDPTTAAQVIDSLHDLLRRLATRRLKTGRYTDEDGAVRLAVPQYDFTEYLYVALSELWFYGSESTQIPERILALLVDLRAAARPEHQKAVRQWLDVVEPVVQQRRQAFPDLPGTASHPS